MSGLALAAVAADRRTTTAPTRSVDALDGDGDANIFDVGAADPEAIRALP